MPVADAVRQPVVVVGAPAAGWPPQASWTSWADGVPPPASTALKSATPLFEYADLAAGARMTESAPFGLGGDLDADTLSRDRVRVAVVLVGVVARGDRERARRLSGSPLPASLRRDPLRGHAVAGGRPVHRPVHGRLAGEVPEGAADPGAGGHQGAALARRARVHVAAAGAAQRGPAVTQTQACEVERSAGAGAGLMRRGGGRDRRRGDKGGGQHPHHGATLERSPKSSVGARGGTRGRRAGARGPSGTRPRRRTPRAARDSPAPGSQATGSTVNVAKPNV